MRLVDAQSTNYVSILLFSHITNEAAEKERLVKQEEAKKKQEQEEARKKAAEEAKKKAEAEAAGK